MAARSRRNRRLKWLAMLGAAVIVIAGWAVHSGRIRISVDENGRLVLFPQPYRRVKPPTRFAGAVVAAAHAQEGDSYDSAYRTIAYPNGDVPAGRGACTDVVIRSLRGAGVDLQSLVHTDITAHPSAYPGARIPDANIDHRRVPNLMRFFERRGASLPIDTSHAALSGWQPGDIVCWRLPGGGTHTGVISDGVTLRGMPLCIDNAGTCVERDALTRWTIIGHYRWPPPPHAGSRGAA